MERLLIGLMTLGVLLGLAGCVGECMVDPVDDGIDPVARLDVIYRDACHETQIDTYTSEMPYPNPEDLLGFYVCIPPGEDYQLGLKGEDSGGVLEMSLATTVFADDADLTILQTYGTVLEKDYSHCAVDSRITFHEVDAHDHQYAHYELIVRDFSGAGSSVRLIVLPVDDEPCSQ
jgi:hypothetical protein